MNNLHLRRPVKDNNSSVLIKRWVGEPVGLTRKRDKNNEHSLNNKSLSYAIGNMKHCF